jgi:CheY-like chemotaxis protein
MMMFSATEKISYREVSGDKKMPQAVSSTPVTKKYEPKHILIIDDDSDIREAFSQILEFEGYVVATAANGREALERLKQFKPSLILLDLMMPVMNGKQFREKQKNDQEISQIPVVVLTADNQSQDRQTIVDVNGYLRKPVRLDTLLDTVRYFCK